MQPRAALWLLCFLVWHPFYVVHCLSAPLLVKTKETFKLAELQYLEAKLQARTYSCERLILDSATGASLFYIDGCDLSALKSWPSSFQRADWVGEILAQDDEPNRLLTEIAGVESIQAGWTLDYLRLHQSGWNDSTTTEYTSRSLMMCAAQSISTPAELVARQNADRLLLVDTMCTIYFIRILHRPVHESFVSIAWNQRPFQYSSSINTNIAEIIVDCLLDAVQGKESPKLFDPTCGSGTFLAYALARGMTTEGWDVQQTCVDGSKENLISFFGESNKWKVYKRDAADNATRDGLEDIDCMVANLPWGQNTIAYFEENTRILEAITPFLKECIPCAFVSKDIDFQTSLTRFGFKVLGSANVPQKQFILPTGYKKRTNYNDGERPISRGKSDCVITIALSPHHEG